jgi:hypothetical protein
VLPEFQGGGTENRTEEFSPISSGLVLCYPNPAGDFVQFDLSGLSSEMRCGQLWIYDLTGKIISQKSLGESMENIVIDTRTVPDGIYLYKIACRQSQTITGKFMVKKF